MTTMRQPEPLLIATLDDALERVRDLSLRLWAVRQSHPAVRSVLRRSNRCSTCREPWPCATLRAAGVTRRPSR